MYSERIINNLQTNPQQRRLGLIVIAIIDIVWLVYALYVAFLFTQQTGTEADIVISIVFFGLLFITVPLGLINMFYVLHAVKQSTRRIALTVIFGLLAVYPIAYIVLT